MRTKRNCELKNKKIKKLKKKTEEIRKTIKKQ